MRRLGAILALIVIAGIGYFLVTFVQVWTFSHQKSRTTVQALIVMGTAEYNGIPSSVLAARLNEARTLYLSGIAPRIALVGGRQPGDIFTEATAGAAYLEARGVPARALIIVPVGNDTYDSLNSAAVALKADHITRVTIISDPFHLYRCVTIAGRVGLNATAYGDIDPAIQGTTELYYLVRETVAVSVGRIIGFSRESTLRHGHQLG
ncbi:MAG: YdcF family protein [Ferrimicrobium sp.]